MKLNCWEFKKCGRHPGGENALVMGVCPAAVDGADNGKNEGRNSGRYCWKMAGTMCGSEVQGNFASKMITCIDCEFYKLVRDEEGDNFII